jgi:hypothetical protein
MIFDDFDLKVMIVVSCVLGFLFLLTNNIKGAGVCLIVAGASFLGRLYFHIKSKVPVPVPPPVLCRPLRTSDDLKFYKDKRRRK